MTLASELELPRSDRWLVNGFEKHFLPGYLRKHFHVVAANTVGLTPDVLGSGSALVVYANHASWWDPMIAMFLRGRLMPDHCMYAPIDAAALERYKVFGRMGFYGIELGSHRGSAEFLRRSLKIVQSPTASLWLTPEGKFCDARELDQPFMPGLAHLAHKISSTRLSAESLAELPTQPRVGASSPSVYFVPAALEYCFWQERLPECLVWFGEPTRVTWNEPSEKSKQQWNDHLFERLRDAQRRLAQASIARDTSHFQVLLSGAAGSWRMYDWARKLTAQLRGRRVSMEHSQGMWTKSES